MSDRTSAELFGNIITLIHESLLEEEWKRELTKEIWELSEDYDFLPYQASIDELIKEYKLEPDMEEYNCQCDHDNCCG